MNILDYFNYDERSHNAKWALKHYDDCSFDKIEIFYNEENEICIEATLTTCGYENDLTFKISEENGIEGDCDCRFFYSINSPCAHYILLAMKLRELYPFNIPFRYKDHHFDYDDFESEREKREKEAQRLMEEKQYKDSLLETNYLINFTKNNIMNSILDTEVAEELHEDVALTIDYNMDYMGKSFTLKVYKKGGRAYLVKNIVDFIDDINNERVVNYGKNLCFRHTMAAFDNYSKEIINMLRVNHVDVDSYNPKYIIPKSKKKFFDLLYKLPDEYVNNVYLFKDTLSGKLSVENHENYIKISEVDRSISCNYRGLYEVWDNEYYIYSYDEDSFCELKMNQESYRLVEYFRFRDYMIVAKESYDDFYNFIYKPSSKYIEYLGYEYNMSENIVEKIEIYGDLNDDYFLSLVVNYYQNDTKKYLYLNKDLPFECELIKKCIDKYEPVLDLESGNIIIDDEKNIVNFINKAIPILTNFAEVYVSDAIKNYTNPKRIGINVGVRIENDLLNVNIDAINISKDEIANILASYHRKKRFHRLKNGEIIAINQKEMEELENTIDEIGIDAKDIADDIKLPLYKALTLETLSNHNELKYDKTNEYKEFISKIEMKDIDSFEVPSCLQNVLKEYQVFGYRWLMTLRNCGLSAILADDMGLGKTIQFLAYVKANKTGDNTSLVICPASLIYNWQDEAHKFVSDLNVLCISGSGAHRKELIKQIKDYDLVITSYDYIRRDFDLYKDIMFDTIALDEAQYIKNQGTKNSKSVKELNAKYRLALSGTPIENSLAELWSIFDFLMPGYLNSYHYFKNNYEKFIVKNNDEEKTKRLKSFVEPFILRRRKMDVLKELPPRIDKTIYIEFNEDEEKLYQANAILANQQLQSMLEVDNINTSKIEILAMLNKLRQICIEPRLQYDNIDVISSKMTACIELLERLKSNNEKVLVFSSYTSLLSLLEDELKKNNFSYFKLTGETPKEERRDLVNKFQKGETDVFLISLKAGGTGLNLTQASAVIHFDPWWNLSAQNQASDRAHRIGQVNTVQVFSLIMKNSIEEKIEELQKRKKELSDLFTEGNNGSIASMTKDDLLYLFNTK